MTKSAKHPSPVGDGIMAGKGAWQFDDRVPDVFDTHVSKSIPDYEYGHKLVAEAAMPYLQQTGRCYELGCSTGILTEKLADISNRDKAGIIALDRVAGMIRRARSRCGRFRNVSFEIADIAHFNFLPARLMVSYYTLHFLHTAARRALVKDIYRCLENGGGFLLFEKIKFSNELKDREMTEKYHAFKKEQGFTEEEIQAKSEALNGVLVPQTEEENLKMMTEAGFDDVEVIYNRLCWQGYIAFK